MWRGMASPRIGRDILGRVRTLPRRRRGRCFRPRYIPLATAIGPDVGWRSCSTAGEAVAGALSTCTASGPSASSTAADGSNGVSADGLGRVKSQAPASWPARSRWSDPALTTSVSLVFGSVTPTSSKSLSPPSPSVVTTSVPSDAFNSITVTARAVASSAVASSAGISRSASSRPISPKSASPRIGASTAGSSTTITSSADISSSRTSSSGAWRSGASRSRAAPATASFGPAGAADAIVWRHPTQRISIEPSTPSTLTKPRGRLTTIGVPRPAGSARSRSSHTTVPLWSHPAWARETVYRVAILVRRQSGSRERE